MTRSRAFSICALLAAGGLAAAVLAGWSALRSAAARGDLPILSWSPDR